MSIKGEQIGILCYVQKVNNSYTHQLGVSLRLLINKDADHSQLHIIILHI